MFFDQEIQPRKAPWLKGLFKRLLNVKGMVVEDVSIDDSPLRPAPVLVVRVRRRRGAWRARSMGWWSPKCRGRSRAAGSPGISMCLFNRKWAV